MDLEAFETIQVETDDGICRIRIHRPMANNTINRLLINECLRVLSQCEAWAKIVVIEGSAEVFCFGADFQELLKTPADEHQKIEAEQLYRIWQKLADGPYVSIAHVRGKVNAGGMGFVAACDIVISEENAVFSLSELLFGIIPACVVPFLVRRIGFARAQYMTLMTQPVTCRQAHAWGLVDACDGNSENLLRKHLLRLRRLSKAGICRYKHFMRPFNPIHRSFRHHAVETNHQVFTDPDIRDKIAAFVRAGIPPWEKALKEQCPVQPATPEKTE